MSASPAESGTAYSTVSVATTLLLYCISGTLLTLVNKLAIMYFPYANLVLVGQNAITVVLLLLGSHLFPAVFQAMPRLTPQIIQRWSPLVLLFVSMLLSSLNALSYVSAVTLIVMRNLSTLCVALFELVWLGEEIKLVTWLALIGIFVGAILFGARDMTFSVEGYMWLAVNVLSTSVYQVYVKKLIKESKELGPFGMSYINNCLSLPMFIAMGVYGNEIPTHVYTFWENTSVETKLILTLSALLGFMLSTSAFMVNKMITATSMMVANNVNKFAVIILSEVFVERTLDDVSTLGTILVMFFGWFYSKTKQVGGKETWQEWLLQLRKKYLGVKVVDPSPSSSPPKKTVENTDEEEQQGLVSSTSEKENDA